MIERARPVRASIIITNHNYARFVGDAITSALCQTVPCKVIVVDDGSTDDSLTVIEEFGDRITVVATANGGQASAFNAGWEVASGPVILFLDGDDLLTCDAVAKVVEVLEARPEAGRCQFRLDWIDEQGRTIPGRFPEPGRRLPTGDLTDRLRSSPADIAWQPTSGNAYRASVLDRLLPMPPEPYRISADHYLSNLSPLYGPVSAIEESLGRYRVHGGNADHRAGFDIDRARDILVRTEETHRHLIERGRARGLTGFPDDPSGFRSVSQTGLRLASYRLGPSSAHPYDGDRSWSLLVAGVRAARSRWDLPPWRRALAAAWFGALAISPRFLVPTIAGRVLTR